MKKYTNQEKFWAGDFGVKYISRNRGDQLLATNLNFFSRALKNSYGIKSVIELGANIGMNLKALKILYPKFDMYGIEINKTAAENLAEIIPLRNIFNGSIIEYQTSKKFDLVFIKGVLIHINPNQLTKVYKKLESLTSRYLLIAEYYNPKPITVTYRGFKNRLFKRDFAGEVLDRYPSFSLIDYGFFYHRDSKFPLDDINWWLLKKHS